MPDMDWVIALIALFAFIPFMLWWIGHCEKNGVVHLDLAPYLKLREDPPN
jgi:hypothetical protein